MSREFHGLGTTLGLPKASPPEKKEKGSCAELVRLLGDGEWMNAWQPARLLKMKTMKPAVTIMFLLRLDPRIDKSRHI